MEFAKTVSITDLLIAIIGLFALIIQWRAYKQQQLEFKTKLKEIEELVNRLNAEREAREVEIEARIIGDSQGMNYSSELWSRSFRARTESHLVLRNDILALTLIVNFIIKQEQNTQVEEKEQTDVLDTLRKACLGIIARADAQKDWQLEFEKISEQQQAERNKIGKRLVSPSQLHNELLSLNEKLEAELKDASERHEQRLAAIEKTFGRTLENLSSIYEHLI